MSEIAKEQRAPTIVRVRNVKKSNEALRFPYGSLAGARTRNRVAVVSKSVIMPPIVQAHTFMINSRNLKVGSQLEQDNHTESSVEKYAKIPRHISIKAQNAINSAGKGLSDFNLLSISEHKAK
jgi:hypothetical protein